MSFIIILGDWQLYWNGVTDYLNIHFRFYVTFLVIFSYISAVLSDFVLIRGIDGLSSESENNVEWKNFAFNFCRYFYEILFSDSDD